jgi:hypothetical protein
VAPSANGGTGGSGVASGGGATGNAKGVEGVEVVGETGRLAQGGHAAGSVEKRSVTLRRCSSLTNAEASAAAETVPLVQREAENLAVATGEAAARGDDVAGVISAGEAVDARLLACGSCEASPRPAPPLAATSRPAQSPTPPPAPLPAPTPTPSPAADRPRRRRRRQRPIPRLYYCPSRAGRYLPFGMDEVDPRGQSQRGNGAGRRTVRRPDFFTKSMGEGSLPSVGLRDVPIYLSGATLVVVPPILVKHWEDQILIHVRPGALRVLSVKSASDIPPALELAFRYDVVLVGFKVLNTVSHRMRADAPSLLCVRFLRIIMDEGHRLGASAASISNFSLVSELLRAERRWIMTGTPTPSTTTTDVRTLQPLLKFLHDASLGLDRHAWARAVQKPYEAYKAEALDCLDRLFARLMVRSCKADLINLPKCVVREVLLDFSDEAAACYNDLVLLARRNLVLTDWFDPNHAESLLNGKNRKECNEFLGNMRSACNFGGVIRMEFDRIDMGETLDLLYREALSSQFGMLASVRPEDMHLHVPHQAKWYSSPEYAPSNLYRAAVKHLSPTALESLEAVNVLPSRPLAGEGPGAGAGHVAGPPSEGPKPAEAPSFAAPGAKTNGIVERGATNASHAAEAVAVDAAGADAGSPPLPEGVNVALEKEPLSLPRKNAPAGSESRLEFRGLMKVIGNRMLHGCHCPACSVFCRLPVISTCGHTVCLHCFTKSKVGCVVPNCGHEYVLDANGVPEQVIELQPSVFSDKWRAEWDRSESTKMKYLVRRLDGIEERAVFVDGKWQRRRPKVIIFSQFHMHHLLLQMTLKNSEKYRDAYVELFTNENEREKGFAGGRGRETADARASRLLQGFIHDEGKHILLLEVLHGSVGLDLSFVEYIFLLEPVWDASVEQQVISRAHRIGAKETVHVERLAMRDSIEAYMLKQAQSSLVGGVQAEKTDADYARRAGLLTKIRPVFCRPRAEAGSTPAAPLDGDGTLVRPGGVVDEPPVTARDPGPRLVEPPPAPFARPPPRQVDLDRKKERRNPSAGPSARAGGSGSLFGGAGAAELAALQRAEMAQFAAGLTARETGAERQTGGGAGDDDDEDARSDAGDGQPSRKRVRFDEMSRG